MKAKDLYKDAKQDSIKSLKEDADCLKGQFHEAVNKNYNLALALKLSTIINIILAITLVLCLSSCQSQKQWSKKGFNHGWVDTSTVIVYDTIKIKGSSLDTLFMHSNDTVFLSDKNFTTKYFYDTVTKNNYLKTIVNNRDTVVVREMHNTSFKTIPYTFLDHLKAVWYVWLGLFVLLCIIALIALFKK